jgi:hypothetical protein
MVFHVHCTVFDMSLDMVFALEDAMLSAAWWCLLWLEAAQSYR